VELSARALRSNCDAITAAAELKPGDRFLGVLPPFHVFGLTGNVLVPTVGGFAAMMIPRFSPAAVYRAIQAFRPTVLMAVPSMYAALLRSTSADPRSFAGFRLLISGGEPLSSAIFDGFRNRFAVDLLEGYGLTETSPVISMSTPRHARRGSVGQPLPNVTVKIVGSEGGTLLPGTDGEIVVRGPSVMRGYHNRPEETAAVLDKEGWFHTGDIGLVDEDGYLRITGRIKDMIIVGGENVFPQEIEDVLVQHAQVAEAAVIGLPDSSRGEVPIAFVTLVTGGTATDADLRRFTRERIAGHKVPREIRSVEVLPRGPTGKVLKSELRRMLDRDRTSGEPG
jgi:long-chain acyl-CoA synthetase